MRAEDVDLHRLERARYLARNLNLLQGLRWIPFGAYFLLSAGWWGWYEAWRPISSLFAFGAVCLFAWLIGIYYARAFGRVQQLPLDGKQMIALIALTSGMLVVGFFDGQTRPSVGVFAIFVALMLLVYFRTTVGLAIHRLLVVTAIAASALLPFFGALSYEQFYGSVFFFLLGVSCIGVGIVDHLILVRAMKPLPEEDELGRAV